MFFLAVQVVPAEVGYFAGTEILHKSQYDAIGRRSFSGRLFDVVAEGVFFLRLMDLVQAMAEGRMELGIVGVFIQ